MAGDTGDGEIWEDFRYIWRILYLWWVASILLWTRVCMCIGMWGVLVFSRCVTISSQTWRFQRAYIYLSQFLWVGILGTASLRSVFQCLIWELQPECLLGLQPHLKAQMEKDPLLSSHHCWWNSIPCGLLDWGFPGGSDGKVSACNVGDLVSIPVLGRSPEEGNGNPLQYPCLGNPMDRGAWWATVHGVAVSLFTFTLLDWGSPFLWLAAGWSSLPCGCLQRGTCIYQIQQGREPLTKTDVKMSCNIIRQLTSCYCRWSVAQLWLTLRECMDCSTPDFHILQHLQEFAPIYVHWVNDAIQLSHPPSPLLLLPSVFPSVRVFSNELALCITWPKYWSFSFSISPSNEYSGLISFRTDWFISLQSKGLSRVLTSNTVWKQQFFGTQGSLWSNSHIHTWLLGKL